MYNKPRAEGAGSPLNKNLSSYYSTTYIEYALTRGITEENHPMLVKIIQMKIKQ